MEDIPIEDLVSAEWKRLGHSGDPAISQKLRDTRDLLRRLEIVAKHDLEVWRQMNNE